MVASFPSDQGVQSTMSNRNLFHFPSAVMPALLLALNAAASSPAQSPTVPPTSPVAQPTSPAAQPASPLGQPASPLAPSVVPPMSGPQTIQVLAQHIDW